MINDRLREKALAVNVLNVMIGDISPKRINGELVLSKFYHSTLNDLMGESVEAWCDIAEINYEAFVERFKAKAKRSKEIVDNKDWEAYNRYVVEHGTSFSLRE